MDLFHRTCLKPSYSLRRQLLLGFGSSAFLTIAIVVILTGIFASQAGNTVQNRASTVLQEQVISSFVDSTYYVGERFTEHMASAEGALQLLVEATRDRVMGYPLPGWEEDRYVPFFDTDQQRNVYPLNMPPVPLDWNITGTIPSDDDFEHTQGRSFNATKAEGIPVTTANGVFLMQGACNPDQKDPNGLGFYEGCTDSNNDIETGGIVQPLNTTRYFHRVSGDLVVLAKPIFEAHWEMFFLVFFFVNGGAGATLTFPGHTSPNGVFVSEGCDWMKEINPYTNKSYGKDEEIARCHPKGQKVSSREYNPLVRGWIRGFLERPNDIFWFGPYNAYGFTSARMISACKAAFDRITGELIGVITVDIDVDTVTDALDESRLHGNASDIVIVKYDDGTVFSDTIGYSNLDPLSKVYETDFISKEYYNLTTSPLDALFDTEWDSEDLRQAYEETVVVCQEKSKVYSAVPIPLPPAKHDPEYRPRFIIINSVSFEVFKAVDEMDKRIEDEFVRVVVASVFLGIIGIVIVFFIVWYVSRMLTRPLLWIEEVAWSILHHKDHRALESLRVAEDDKNGEATRMACTETEITKLVTEFRSLMNCFSGVGTSTVAESNRAEIPNEMTWRSDFQQLYSIPPIKKEESRAKTAGASTTQKTDEDSLSDPSSKKLKRPSLLARNEDNVPSDSKPGPVVVPAPMKKNQGRNLTGQIGHLIKNELENEFSPSHVRAYRSSLFWWILVLIALPLVLINALICGIVSHKMVNAVPQWVDIVEESSLILERNARGLTAAMKASVAEFMMQQLIRDLHLLTRVAGWLLFGGVQRSGALIDMIESTEDCKNYPWDLSCPFFSSERAVCDCAWKDIKGIQCTEFNDKVKSRTVQLRHWHTQARDADPVTGNRPSAQSYPEFDSQPNETLWWNTTEDLPGWEKGSTASGFETAYDRIRTTSAMAVVDIPIANYANALGRQRQDLGTYVGFDADGTLTGYKGCDYNFTYMSHWNSTEDNHAAEIAPDLCPLGKYGYDSRCREWYAEGKENYFSQEGHIHLTAPYIFASSKKIAMSATFPLVNPQTNEYAGQTLLDFTPELIRQALRRLGEPFGFMITPGYDRAGGDTVIGPNETDKDWESADILDLLFDNETASSGNREYFKQNILPNMKKGDYNVTTYRRWLDGTPEETLVLAYRPVYVDAYQALNPGTFHRGVNLTEVLAYSIGIVCSEEGLRRPFQEIEDDVTDDLARLQLIYICLVAFISVAFTVFTCLITVSITKPMITLLRVVERINAGGMEDELPPLQGGSREVHQVYNSFAKLVKIVRMSNIAFFSGNLEQAHEFISDALKLYRKIEDEKAIGIACNNLGNTLYAMLHEAKISGGLDADIETVVEYDTAISHFNCAIDIGQRQFDEATGVDDKSEFAQQLADRLFNRALFRLLADSCGLAPDDAKESALADFHRVRELDYDVKEFWLDRKLLLDKSGVCYSRLLRRIHGLIDFYEDEMVREQWNPKELIEEADQLLFAAWNDMNAPIFESVTPVGRLQQLEGAAMRLDLLLGKKMNAARLAMRIFSEDEYILECTFSIAAEALLSLMRDAESEAWSATTKALTRYDLRKMVRGCKSRSLNLGKCVILAFEINEQYEGDPMLDKVRANCLRLYDLNCFTDDYFGVVAHTINGELNLDLCSKAQYHGRQRAVLDIATFSTTDRVCPSLPYAVQMIVDSTATTENDSYVVLIADGYSFDPATYSAVKVQLDRLNQERKSTVHLFILGMDVDEDEVVEACKSLCTVSKLSLYVDVNMENMDSAFAMIGGIISGRALAMGCFQSLTMEKF